ncbi:MAG TPA: VOC family protein [Acidimicrobiia bacterium]|nr:VOC family protein [Acidimicrobiia bacterium]
MPQNPPEGYHTLTPQIVVEDARETIDFVQNVFDADLRENYEDDGRIVHSEVMIGDSRLMIASASEEFGVFPLMVNLYVDDVDATFAKAIEHGATSLRDPADQFYGDRTGGVIDPQGNQWWISTHIEDVSEEEMRRRAAESVG